MYVTGPFGAYGYRSCLSVNVSLFGPGTVYVIVYFGPRSPFGRWSSIGSGVWRKTAGKNPACSARFIVGDPGSQQPVNVMPPPPPGPSIVAADGPFPSAAVGRASETSASVRIRRFIGTPF